MPRREKSPFEELLDLLVILPPKIGLALIVFIFLLMRFAIPYFLTPAPTHDAIHAIPTTFFSKFSYNLAPYLAAALLLTWTVGIIRRYRNHKQLDAQTGLDSIQQLSWQQFETLLATYYQRQGYAVEHTGSTGPDGGVDLRLRKDNQLTLVQCKHWKTRSVGVKPLRELQGLVAAQNAARGILVTSGQFTPDAETEFQNNRAIHRINGNDLVQMIRDAQSPAIKPAHAHPAPPTPSCPTCQSPMVERTAKKGSNIGGKFWGCARFPDCRGKRELAG